jgi:hypothetical protein
MEINKERSNTNQKQNEGKTNTKNNLDTNSHFNVFTFIKAFIITAGLILLYINTYTGIFLVNTNPNPFFDKSFNVTAGLNKYLTENPEKKYVLIASSSFLIDFIVLYSSIWWILFGKSWRLLGSLGVFYGFRSVIQVKYSFNLKLLI